MKNKLFNIISFALALTLVLGVFTGCSSSPEGEDPVITSVKSDTDSRLIRCTDTLKVTTAADSSASALASKIMIIPETKFTLGGSGKNFTLKFAESLIPDTVYTVCYLCGERAANKWAFQTISPLDVTDMILPEKAGDKTITLAFSHDDVNISNGVIISPETAGEWTINGNKATFTASDGFIPAVKYTLNIKKELSCADSLSIGKDISKPFTIALPDNSPVAGDGDDFADNFAAGTTAATRVNNVPNGKGRAEIYSYSDFRAYTSSHEKYAFLPLPGNDDGLLPDTSPIMSDIRVKNGVMTYSSIPDAGYYIAKIIVKNTEFYHMFTVNDLAVSSVRFGADLKIWVNNVKTGKPLADTEVLLDNVYDERTDLTGVATFSLDADAAAHRCIMINAPDGGCPFVEYVNMPENTALISAAAKYTVRLCADASPKTEDSGALCYYADDVVRFFGVVDALSGAALPKSVDVFVGDESLSADVTNNGAFTFEAEVEEYEQPVCVYIDGECLCRVNICKNEPKTVKNAPKSTKNHLYKASVSGGVLNIKYSAKSGKLLVCVGSAFVKKYAVLPASGGRVDIGEQKYSEYVSVLHFDGEKYIDLGRTVINPDSSSALTLSGSPDVLAVGDKVSVGIKSAPGAAILVMRLKKDGDVRLDKSTALLGDFIGINASDSLPTENVGARVSDGVIEYTKTPVMTVSGGAPVDFAKVDADENGNAEYIFTAEEQRKYTIIAVAINGSDVQSVKLVCDCTAAEPVSCYAADCGWGEEAKLGLAAAKMLGGDVDVTVELCSGGKKSAEYTETIAPGEIKYVGLGQLSSGEYTARIIYNVTGREFVRECAFTVSDKGGVYLPVAAILGDEPAPLGRETAADATAVVYDAAYTSIFERAIKNYNLTGDDVAVNIAAAASSDLLKIAANYDFTPFQNGGISQKSGGAASLNISVMASAIRGDLFDEAALCEYFEDIYTHSSGTAKIAALSGLAAVRAPVLDKMIGVLERVSTLSAAGRLYLALGFAALGDFDDARSICYEFFDIVDDGKIGKGALKNPVCVTMLGIVASMINDERCEKIAEYSEINDPVYGPLCTAAQIEYRVIKSAAQSICDIGERQSVIDLSPSGVAYITVKSDKMAQTSFSGMGCVMCVVYRMSNREAEEI